MLFGATVAAMNAFRTYGNDYNHAIRAAVTAWYNAYPIEGEYGMTAEADEFITNKYLFGIGWIIAQL